MLTRLLLLPLLYPFLVITNHINTSTIPQTTLIVLPQAGRRLTCRSWTHRLLFKPCRLKPISRTIPHPTPLILQIWPVQQSSLMLMKCDDTLWSYHAVPHSLVKLNILEFLFSLVYSAVFVWCNCYTHMCSIPYKWIGIFLVVTPSLAFFSPSPSHSRTQVWKKGY